jgi:pimeloyl-ACP methyl ester carboxylesterase
MRDGVGGVIATRTVVTRHARVHYLEGGDGPDLVFLHDASGITAAHPLLTRLAGRFHVVAPLLPGYGESEDAPTIRDMLDVTLHSFDVLAALGLSRPMLVGHSLGGMIAAEMAAVAPNEVERLCLIAPFGLWLEACPIADLFALLPAEFPPLLFDDPAAGAALITEGADLVDPAFLTRFLVTKARQLGMAGKILFPVPERGLAERLYRITARTLLLWGENDRLIPRPYAAAFQAGINGAELALVPRSGHMVPIEQPDFVVHAIERFAAGVARLTPAAATA